MITIVKKKFLEKIRHHKIAENRVVKWYMKQRSNVDESMRKG